MKASKRLQVILKLAKQQEQIAARQLQVCQQKKLQQESQLQQLHQFHDEYCNQLRFSDDAKLTNYQWQSLNFFLEKLKKMLISQQDSIRQADVAIQRQRRVFEQAYCWHNALLKLHDKYLKREQEQLTKQEEKMIADMINRRYC